ncbi:type II toxin-antitoxin system RelE family toxin [Mycolicibacterium sp. XJ1904]
MKLQMHNDARKFLEALEAKQNKQVSVRVFGLMHDPSPHDMRHLSGYPNHFRIDVGEFRVVFLIDGDTVNVKAVGRRNDDAVYRKFRRR